MAEWLRSGLQSRLHRFDSGRRLLEPLLALLGALVVHVGGAAGALAPLVDLGRALDVLRGLVDVLFGHLLVLGGDLTLALGFLAQRRSARRLRIGFLTMLRDVALGALALDAPGLGSTLARDDESREHEEGNDDECDEKTG